MTVQVTPFALGDMKNLVYLLQDSSSQTCMVVDPAWDVPTLIEAIERQGLNCVGVLLTHGHFDHVEGLAAFTAHYPVPVYLSALESPSLIPNNNRLVLLDDRAIVHCGNSAIYCMQTPGHSPGGMCFYCEPVLLTGDTLFVDGCGRCSFLGSNVDDMWLSLQRILRLPNTTQIYPGHHYGHALSDTLSSQRVRNRFLSCKTKEIFVRKRMGC